MGACKGGKDWRNPDAAQPLSQPWAQARKKGALSVELRKEGGNNKEPGKMVKTGELRQEGGNEKEPGKGGEDW